MSDTDTNRKPLPAAKVFELEIRQFLKDAQTSIEDRQREIKIMEGMRARMLELLHRVTIADEPTPVVGTGSQTRPAVKPPELEKGKR